MISALFMFKDEQYAVLPWMAESGDVQSCIVLLFQYVICKATDHLYSVVF